MSWSKAHDWKSCKRDERFGGSNPPLSAALDGALAVPCNLQSATAGLNSQWRDRVVGVCPGWMALKFGSFATDPREPRQDRKVAAISGLICVLRGSLF